MILALLRKSLPVILALAAGALLIAEVRYPVFVLSALPIWIGAYVLTFVVMSGREKRHASFWLLAVPPILVCAASVLFLLIVDNTAVRWVFTIVPPIAIGLFGYTQYLFVHQPARYQPYALEYLSLTMNAMGFFLISTSFIGYVIFVSLPQWVMIVGIFGLSGLLIAETLWVSKVPSARQPTLILVGSLLLTQAASAVLLLPTSFLVGGALLTLLYYLVVGLFRAHALASCDRIVIQRYVGVSTLAVVLIFASARWL